MQLCVNQLSTPRSVVSLAICALRSRGRNACRIKASVVDTLQHLVVSAPQLMHHAPAALYQLADVQAAAQAASDAVSTAAQALPDAASSATQAAAQTTAAAAGGGPFGFLADGFEFFLKVLDSGLERAGVPYSYGFAIIILTVMVKAATFPLTKKQVESTLSMQALSPRLKELQAKYAGDPEKIQLETAKLYRDAGVNPLAGCLPTLATIPVFIGLYQALTKAANDGLLTDGFLWIPSLGGPVSVMARNAGSGVSWLFPFVDNHPPLGWGPTAAYLVLPVLLVLSQYVSQKIISTSNSNDPSQAQAQAILKFLPLMIGWFSLNVPSGLTLYWLVNNILSTAQQLYLKRNVQAPAPAMAAGPIVEATIVKPKEERVKKVTGQELNARKKKPDGSVEVVEPEVMNSSASNSGSRRGQKFRATKAQEASRQAAAQSGGTQMQAQSNGNGAAPTTTREPAPKVPDAPPMKDNSTKN